MGHWRAITHGVAGSITATSGASVAQVRAARDPDLSDSHADSAGSIPVTRSHTKVQVRWPTGPDRWRLCMTYYHARVPDRYVSRVLAERFSSRRAILSSAAPRARRQRRHSALGARAAHAGPATAKSFDQPGSVVRQPLPHGPPSSHSPGFGGCDDDGSAAGSGGLSPRAAHHLRRRR
jgi:hypothetical protein